ncbi:MAG: hypothetical protein D3915_02115 [Candidatus Electrothrix sp. AU1_5]|nr:hypothetical protein [Candidatus Electrothrix gigas]
MKHQHAIKLLTQCKQELRERFGVTKLMVFGSTVRDTATDASDVDILVTFDGPTNSKKYFGLLFYLEDLLECTVDLVTEKALRSKLRPYVEPKDQKRPFPLQSDLIYGILVVTFFLLFFPFQTPHYDHELSRYMRPYTRYLAQVGLAGHSCGVFSFLISFCTQVRRAECRLQ